MEAPRILSHMPLTPGSPEVSDVAIFVVVVLTGALTAVGILWHNEKKRRGELERQVAAQSRAAAQAAVSSGSNVDRDGVMFDLHRRINELGIRKLEAEVTLLQGQVKARGSDEDRMVAAREFHELNVEKTKLEIDSLRLHIAEQRKRMDDFGLGGGGHD